MMAKNTHSPVSKGKGLLKKAPLLLLLPLLFLSLLSCQQEEPSSDSDSMSAQEYAAYQDRILELYAPALSQFDLDPADYIVFIGNSPQHEGFDTKAIPPTAFMGLDMLVIQESGDYVPLYLWEDAAASMTVLTKDEGGAFTKATFRLEPSPDLSDHDFRHHWTPISAPESWTP